MTQSLTLLEEDARNLLRAKVAAHQTALTAILEGRGITCDHETSAKHLSEGTLTAIQVATQRLQTDALELLEDAPLGERTEKLAAVVAKQLELTPGLPEELMKPLEAEYWNDLLASDDPVKVAKRHLMQYTDENDWLTLPVAAKEASELHHLIQAYGTLSGALHVIASGKLSCGTHAVRYAGGVKSAGNRIFTAQEVAKHGLDEAATLFATV